jgi:FAD/FMN-containing dehydrogenase
VGTAGPLPYLAGLHGRPLAGVGYVWVGDPVDGRALLPAFRQLGQPVAERFDEITYLQLQSQDDDVQGHTFRRYWKGHYLRQLNDAAIDAFLSRGTDGVSSVDERTLPSAGLQTHGGAIADVGADEAAFDHRDVLVEFDTRARWDDAAEDEARIAAARRHGAAIEPYASGAYVNALADEGQAGVERAYGSDKLARLAALKARYDPDNVFHLNHNIRPSG